MTRTVGMAAAQEHVTIAPPLGLYSGVIRTPTTPPSLPQVGLVGQTIIDRCIIVARYTS